MTTGGKAEVWAEHFIAVHLHEIGLTCDQPTTLARASPTDVNDTALGDTIFEATSRSGGLLAARGFSVSGNVAWTSS